MLGHGPRPRARSAWRCRHDPAERWRGHPALISRSRLRCSCLRACAAAIRAACPAPGRRLGSFGSAHLGSAGSTGFGRQTAETAVMLDFASPADAERVQVDPRTRPRRVTFAQFAACRHEGTASPTVLVARRCGSHSLRACGSTLLGPAPATRTVLRKAAPRPVSAGADPPATGPRRLPPSPPFHPAARFIAQNSVLSPRPRLDPHRCRPDLALVGA
jgi:hypothetical protein